MSGVAIGNATAVITGASSGIGRATAIALAERGAAVVVAARSDEDLDEVVRACKDAGGDAVAVPTDVSIEADVVHLAERAVDRFGGFDVWINGAAVMTYGSFWDTPAEAYRQVLETNLFGTIHGARAALHHFRERGHGVIINVGSLYGRVTTPYVSPYVVSKFGVRGLSQSLRQETAGSDGIDVCAVLPEAVDTPIFRQAANYTGREVTALPLTIDPDRVVRAILRCIERPKPEVIVGIMGHALAWFRAAAPKLYERITPMLMDTLAFREGAAPRDDGNVFAPEPERNQVDGGWREERRTLRRVAAVAAATAAVAPLAAWFVRRRS